MARLTAKVIAEEVQSGRLEAEALSLSDTQETNGSSVRVSVAGGSRSKYLFSVQVAAVNHSHFVYDFLGMARAHCRLPRLRRPYLAWIHGIEVWEDTRPDRLACARRAAMLLSNTDYTRARAERLHGGFGRARVCWLATETDEPPPPQPKQPGPPAVLVLARMDEGGGYKGHRELIHCWPRVVSAVPEARLVVVGDGPGRAAIQQLAAQSRGRIELRGFLPDNALEAVWASASVFAMPSRGEGFGLVYIEAMRHGLPVVASVHDAAPEINLDGQTGFNVDLNQPGELAERLIFLLKNPNRAAELGRKGFERWQEHFRFSCFRRNFLPLLHEFLRI